MRIVCDFCFYNNYLVPFYQQDNYNSRSLRISAIMEKIPDQVGYLVLTEDGAVLESGGELENDERVATIITDLVTLSNR